MVGTDRWVCAGFLCLGGRRAAVRVGAAKRFNPQYLYGNWYPDANPAPAHERGDGKRTGRRGLVLLRGLSIATKGFDPESRVFIFRHFLATQLKTLDSGCCRSGNGRLLPEWQ